MRDSRSSEGRTQEDLDIMAAAGTIRVPKAPAAIGDLPSYSTNGTLNWSHGVEPIREPNLVEDKPIQGQGNHITRQRGTGKRSASSEGKGGQSPRTWVKLREGEQIVDLFN